MGNHGNKGFLIELVVYGIYVAQAFPFFAAFFFFFLKMILEGNLSPFDQTGGDPSTSQVLISFQGIRFRSVHHLCAPPPTPATPPGSERAP